ncbi:dihydrolipoamide acetyltransferase family protein [Lysinibacillus sp. LZ02]|uniref:dihydrolipoamide acetyltransferase family protein n=1 Tax=Lysinibacillus sp. LZ02 TaxID=3420668 RepID=UPI003D36AC45
MFDFLLPDIGEGLHEAEVLKWFVAVGQKVKANELLVEVQTDKAVVEITAPVSGVVHQLGGEVGDSIIVGTLLCQFDTKNTPTLEKEEVEKTEKTVPIQPEKTENSNKRTVKAAPSVRKAARNLGINIEKVVGSGPKGRVLRADLEQYLAQKSDVPTTIEKSMEWTGQEKAIPIRGLRKAIFENMEKSVANAVLCTGMEKLNVTKLIQFKKEAQQLQEFKTTKLTYLPIILKAVASSLKEHQIFNSKVNEENRTIIISPVINIGVAVATEEGLLVPVIKNADKKSIYEIAKELEILLEKVKTKKISVAELTGSTFTVSSTGSKGGIFATPIPNYPEVAILGVHKIVKEPVVVNDAIEVGHTMTLSCTFDHRVIDGEPVGVFMQTLANYLENPIRFLID